MVINSGKSRVLFFFLQCEGFVTFRMLKEFIVSLNYSFGWPRCMFEHSFPDFSQSFRTANERLEPPLTVLVYVFVAAVRDRASHFAFSVFAIS